MTAPPAKAGVLAERAFAKLAPALTKHFGGQAAARDPGAVCFERKELGPLSFLRKDRELVMIAGPVKMTRAKQ